MPPKSEAIKERIARASEAIDQDSRLRGTKATVQFVVPYDRLIVRQRDHPASNSRGRHNKKLLVLQDRSLRDSSGMVFTLFSVLLARLVPSKKLSLQLLL